jgi:sugar O-acyltransferase (sialic acid O-acetyltransferase NeuD family)
MKKIIIFGLSDYAELAHYYIEHDTEYEVVAFSVHKKYMPEDARFKNLPVVEFEDVEKIFSPAEFKFFAPMSPKNMNRDREKIFFEIKNKGYQFISYVSSKATVFENQIGDNCFILEDNTIQPFTTIGDNVVLWSGNHVGHHGKIGDHVTMTSHVVMSGHCEIGPYSFLGVNATLRDGIKIAEGSFVAMACAVTKSTEAWGVYRGNPGEKMKMSSVDLKF